MSFVTYQQGNATEWEVEISCDGVQDRFRVRRRRGEQHSSEEVREIHSYQLWSGDRIAGEFIIPVVGDRQQYEGAILRILHRILGCSIAKVENDASTLFGMDR